MKTRVEIYKQYRNQLKREQEILEKINYKSSEIKTIENKLKKISPNLLNNEIDDLFNYVYLKKTNLFNEIRVVESVSDKIDDRMLDEILEKVIYKNNDSDFKVFDENGKISLDFLGFNENFQELEKWKLLCSKKQAEISPIINNLRDNLNLENYWVIESRKKSNQENFFNEKINYEGKIVNTKFNKVKLFIFAALSFICLIIVIVLMVL